MVADQAADHAAHEASPAALAELSPAGQLVLCAARSTTRGGEGPGPCLLFHGAGLGGESLAAFVALLGLLGACGTLPLFRSLHDPFVSADELRLVAAIGALQDGAPWRAQRILAVWTTGAAAPRAIALMAIAARGLAAAGLIVTKREASPTLH